MSTIYYPGSDNCSGGAMPRYTCEGCIDVEGGRVSSVFLYNSDVAWVNRESQSEWDGFINSGDVIVIATTTGNYDGGSDVEASGFGRQETIVTGRSHVLTWRDPNIYDNCDFYGALAQQTEWKVGWVTENFTYFSEAVATFSTRIPVEDDLTSQVVYESTAKWSSLEIPCPFNKPANTFEQCYAISD